MNQSRTKNSIKNINYSFVSYFIVLLLQFVNRTVFIQFLSSTYLGLNGLFSNVLSFLALTELGIGSAMNYALYKPLARGDTELVKSVMRLYRRLYRVIGCTVLVLGSALTPFLPFLIQDMPADIPYIYVYYVLFVVDSGASYFYTYKRSLIICSQREYISTAATTVSRIVLCVTQVAVLAVSRNYAAYLIVAVVVTLGENVLVSVVADRLFPYLKEKTVAALPEEVSADIKKNVFAMMFHKIGGVVVFSTDNLIISKYAGLVAVGLYSNYTLVIDSLNRLMTKMFAAMTASVGNLVLTDDKKHVEQVLYRILFMNFWMRGFCAVALFCLFQPFIFLWLGEEYLLSFFTVLVIAVNFYIGGMRSTVNIFKEASGMFWYDRYKPLIESVLNIVLSIWLVGQFGVAGVLLGTIGSTVLVPFWVEPYVLFRHYFGKGIGRYMAKQLLYGAVTVLAGAGCFFSCGCVSGGGAVSFLLRIGICVLVPNLVFAAVFCRSREFLYFRDTLWNLFHRLLKRKN